MTSLRIKNDNVNSKLVNNPINEARQVAISTAFASIPASLRMLGFTARMYAIVINVVPGGPSQKAGLLQGDRIIKVGERVIAGTKTPQDSMVRMMKGPAGTKVKISVSREKQMIPFEITRGKIPVHSVDAAFMVTDTVGYIKLTKFSRTTYKEFVEASSKLMDQGMTHLIFDLRDNTGGYFDQALMISNEFLEKNAAIVYMQGRKRARQQCIKFVCPTMSGDKLVHYRHFPPPVCHCGSPFRL